MTRTVSGAVRDARPPERLVQAGNPLARRTNDGKDGGGWPSMGSIAAKFRGANAPGMPGYIALGPSRKSESWGRGRVGRA